MNEGSGNHYQRRKTIQSVLLDPIAGKLCLPDFFQNRIHQNQNSMLIIQSYSSANLLCFLTMLCWGSWANTQKLK
jgi:hypothetical protein